MWQAGTPCPFEGKIGMEAKELWNQHPEKLPANIVIEDRRNDTTKGFLSGLGAAAILLLIL
jgi:hypothetical protein